MHNDGEINEEELEAVAGGFTPLAVAGLAVGGANAGFAIRRFTKK
ncbi:MAG: class IIb bacteriocin, lactobin A/cerein 7B family [Xenococcaceae cyanobacterium]